MNLRKTILFIEIWCLSLIALCGDASAQEPAPLDTRANFFADLVRKDPLVALGIVLLLLFIVGAVAFSLGKRKS